MTGLDRPLQAFFRLGNVLHIIPCRYNLETNRFEANTRQNLLAFVINLILFAAMVCYDWYWMSEGNMTIQSPTSNTILALYLVTFPPTIVYIQLQIYANRTRITALFNDLFVDECWWGIVRADSRLGLLACACSVTVLVYLGVLVAHLGHTAGLFEAVLDMARFYSAAVLVVVYVLCVQMLRIRLVQLQDSVQRNSPTVRGRWVILLDQWQCSVRLVEEINRIFSGIMLALIMQTQLQLSNQYFALYCYVQHGITFRDATWVSQSWASQFLLILLAVGFSCEWCHDQLDETIVSIRNRYEGDDDDNKSLLKPPAMLKHMDKFLLDNLDQKKRFNACGFFDIDGKLICMVLISITTHLLVLIQFHQRELD